MATSPLHLAIFCGSVPSIPRSIHLPNVQQGIFSTLESEDSLPQPHRREAIQVSSSRLRQGVQRSKQHEETRARMPYFRRRVDDVIQSANEKEKKQVVEILMYKVLLSFYVRRMSLILAWLIATFSFVAFSRLSLPSRKQASTFFVHSYHEEALADHIGESHLHWS